MPKYDFNNVAKKLLTVAASDSCWMITFSFTSSNLYQKTKRNAKIKKNKQKKSQTPARFFMVCNGETTR